METRWNNYKDKTGRLTGAYLYLPEVTEKCIAHVYKVGLNWRLVVYYGNEVEAHVFSAGTLNAAKLYAARQVAHMSVSGTASTPKKGSQLPLPF